MSYRLHRRQVVGGTVSEVFEFFKDPRNLEAITPQWLDFRVTGSTDREVRTGTRINYELRLHGLPLKWESRITDYVDGERFTDEQIKGPYRRWHHEHHFHEVEGGVAVEDVVNYELPLGILGRVAHAVVVQRQLRDIFNYRELHIARLFPVQATHLNKAVPA